MADWRGIVISVGVKEWRSDGWGYPAELDELKAEGII
jgi:hypothetical protein